MFDSLPLALAIAAKDIRAELRSRTALQSALVFAALVLVVFNFSRDPTILTATDLAPSVLWVTFALAAMVTLNRAFTVERENGAIDGLLLAPVPREALFLGKLLANLAFVGTVELVTLPLFVLFFNVSLGRALPGLLGVTALATVGFVAVGTDLQRHGGPNPVRRADAPGPPAAVHGAAPDRGSPGDLPVAGRPSIERDVGLA